MPFTFSHPSIVLPLTYLPKKWISLTGIVIGSLTPDFEYFLRMKIQSTYSHTIHGILRFDLPLGLLIAFLFHNIIRNDLYKNLPTFLKSRFGDFRSFSWNKYFKENWCIVILSMIIGIVSHILWDNFTHQDAYLVQTIPFLTKIINIYNLEIPIFKILQHLSTIVGGSIIVYIIYKLPNKKVIKSIINLDYWFTLSLLALIIFLIRLGIQEVTIKQYGNIIVTAISSILLSLIITPLIIKQIRYINKQIFD
ncbi:hypothetical protein XF24_00915 [candidate division SR1 bacterium Aalborg_AAW-1]|nr:hypothetical protein XF24_00915 [candidate division SR1 bacterium Aalborg_AAW-1]